MDRQDSLYNKHVNLQGVLTVLAMKAYKGSGGKAPLIPNFCTRWGVGVRRSLMSRENNPRYLLCRSPGWGSSTGLGEKNLLILPGLETWAVQPAA